MKLNLYQNRKHLCRHQKKCWNKIWTLERPLPRWKIKKRYWVNATETLLINDDKVRFIKQKMLPNRWHWWD